jgi:hypothetical protein
VRESVGKTIVHRETDLHTSFRGNVLGHATVKRLENTAALT